MHKINAAQTTGQIGAHVIINLQVTLLVHAEILVLLGMALDRKVTSELKALCALPVTLGISCMARKRERVYQMAVGRGDSRSAKVISS